MRINLCYNWYRGQVIQAFCELSIDFTLQVETMFEKYNFAAVFVQIQAVLTLYAQGAYKVD